MSVIAEYSRDCLLLRAVARVLSLGPTTTSTALVLLHQVRNHPAHAWTLSPQDLVGACVWVACKADEVNCSCNQLLNTIAVLSSPQGQQLLDALAPRAAPPPPAAAEAAAAAVASPPQPAARHSSHGGAPPAPSTGPATAAAPAPAAPAAAEGPGPPGAPDAEACRLSAHVLTADAYYSAKARLFAAEQHLLRSLRFQLLTPQPHAHLLNLVRLVRPGPAATAAATCLMNDALVFTRLAVQHPPEVLAAASLAAAMAAAGARFGGDGGGGGGDSRQAAWGWVELLDVPQQRVASVTADLLRMWEWLQQKASQT